MRILASHDGLGCGHIRLVKPLSELAKHGHDVTLVVSQDSEAIEKLRNGRDYDIVIGQRFAGWEGMSMWRRARTPSNRLVYETDDDLFTIEKVNWAAYEMFNKNDVQEAIKGYMQLSDLVTVTTSVLAEVQVRHGAQKTAVLPNCVPEFALELPKKSRDRLRIGWVGGASHGADIHEAVPGVRKFMTRNPGWDLYMGGTDYRPSFKVRPWGHMIYEPWVQINDDEKAYYESVDFDIGIVPVRNTEFSLSKSAVKALDYNSRGIPVIASDIAPYRDYIVHGENGFLVKEQHEWGKYLNLLAKNPDLRAEMGRKAKEHASRFTWEGNWKMWEAAYEELFA